MLRELSELPTDKRIAGVHLVPFTDDGSIVMGWNKHSALLETVGGRVEAGETLEEAFRREAIEEAGIRLNGPFVPFASYYWASTDTYTVWFLATVADFGAIPPGFETSGRVVCNIATAKGIISHLAHDPGREHRLAVLSWAEARFAAGAPSGGGQ